MSILRLAGTRCWLKLLSGLILLSTACGAYAFSCPANPTVVNLPARVAVADDAAVGTFLSDWTTTTLRVTCTFQRGDSAIFQIGIAHSPLFVATGTRSGTYDIFSSGLAGVGIIVQVRSTQIQPCPRPCRAGNDVALTNRSTAIAPSSVAHGLSGRVGSQSIFDFAVQVRLVKTGNIASGTIPGGAFMSLISGTDTYDGGNFTANNLPVTLSTTSNVVATVRTCTVTPASTAIAIPFGRFIRTSELTGINSTSGWGRNFTISLNCARAASNVHMVLSDATTPANRTSTLSLTAASTAAGMGIEIWRAGGAGGALRYGPDSAAAGTQNQFSVYTANGSAVQNVDLTFSWRYIQTAAVLRAGTANGNATFTMSYQ